MEPATSGDGEPRRKGPTNEARWGEILEAAAQVFYERGFKSARLKDIAARVGLLAGSLYYYIDSKEDLLFALEKEVHEGGVATTVEPSEVRGAPATVRLDAFIRRWMVLQETQTIPTGLVERDLPFLTRAHRVEIDELRHHLHGFVRGILEQGVDEGAFDPTLDQAVVTNSLFELLNTTNLWFRRSGPLTHHDVGAWYSHLFLSGLDPAAGSLLRPSVPLS